MFVRGGSTPGRLIDLLIALQRRHDETTRRLDAAKQRIAELESRFGRGATSKLDQPFSLRAEEQRQEALGKRKRRKKRPPRLGRVTTAEKIRQAARAEKVYPAGVPESDCKLSHTRPVWRLENGRAVLLAYEVYRGPKNQYVKVLCTLGRSEFGIEIVIAIAYLVYVAGLSFDKVCLLLNFFQSLRLHKSQADSLLHQLSRHWTGEFERLCTLLANSAVVHADETSWSIHSVWAFLSEKVRLLFFGVHKDAEALREIRNPATFGGMVISDDAAVYAKFTHSQKCWAHLRRKAIKLTLLEPTNAEYREFADRLLGIYRAACRTQVDQRFSDAGRARKVTELDDQILELCGSVWVAELPKGEGAADDYRLLCNELMRLMLNRQLFAFVTAEPTTSPRGITEPVAGTNNASERTLRDAAAARKAGRTNKTQLGARRQTIVVSVLESLRKHLPTFTLATVIDEVRRWYRTGRSCFAELADELGLANETSTRGILDRVLPQPSG